MTERLIKHVTLYLQKLYNALFSSNVHKISLYNSLKNCHEPYTLFGDLLVVARTVYIKKKFSQ